MNEHLKKELLELETKALVASGHQLNAEKAHKEYPSEYFAEYQDNLFCKMSDEHKMQYENGGGGELSDKNGSPAHMKSVLSSSAMTFNLLGNREIHAKEGNAFFAHGTYKIEYEKKFITVNTPGGRQHPACLDAFLLNDTNAIFCEMKMTEWMKPRGENDLLSSSYCENKYYYFDTEDGKETIKAFENFRESLFSKMTERKSKNGYKSHLFKYYDAWQMYKHILGIYNMSSAVARSEAAKQEKDDVRLLPPLKTARLVNVIFEPPEDAFSDEDVRKEYRELLEEEHEEFAIFKECFEKSGVKEAFKKDCGIDFSLELLTAAQFMDCFELNDRTDYLQRYRLDKPAR